MSYRNVSAQLHCNCTRGVGSAGLSQHAANCYFRRRRSRVGWGELRSWWRAATRKHSFTSFQDCCWTLVRVAPRKLYCEALL